MNDTLYSLFEGIGGHDKWVAIEAAEEAAKNERLPLNHPELETKPISMRLPIYKVAALESIASKMGMTRQDLIMRLVEHGLGSAIAGYAMGWASEFETPEQVAFDFLKEMDSLSEVSKNYLIDAVAESFGLHDAGETK
jgi:predicted DNA binding CopG/RHH family protein